MKTTEEKAFGYEDGLTAKERLVKANETAIWKGRCRKCGEEIEGTLAQLKAHVCHV